MTTERPPATAVAEDTGSLIGSMDIDSLVTWRDNLDRDIKDLQRQKGAIDQELWHRAMAARPEVETKGTAELAGADVSVTVGADRTWAWNEAELLALQAAKDANDKPLLTEVEYGKLVTWQPKVNGVFYNSLLRRGGFVAEALERCRVLKSARPTIEVKARE